MIGECDLIFDATANPDILNLVSAVAASVTKPVMWAEIFGGGTGGLIARCRPGVEPPPQYMRRAIENWFGERGPPPVRSTRTYETERDGVWLARPLLDIPKSRLVATLGKAKIAFADDPTNRDVSFTRPRLRALMPALVEEGGDSRNLARLATRLARANAAIEVLADGAERYLALRDRDDASRFGFDAGAFAGLPEEIRLRLLKRAIDRAGHEGPAELGKVEALLAALDRAVAATGPAIQLATSMTFSPSWLPVRLFRPLASITYRARTSPPDVCSVTPSSSNATSNRSTRLRPTPTSGCCDRRRSSRNA
jgi:hypothetical protein